MLDPATLALVAITDDLRDGIDGLVGRCRSAVAGGATMIQLRLKRADARTIASVGRALVNGVTVPVIVNDRIDVALACGAAGVHLGEDDLAVLAARAIVPTGFIVGASLGADHEIANARHADYVGIGPVFSTDSKSDAGAPIGPDGLRRLAGAVGLPAVAIGGIGPDTAAAALAAGAVGVAVIRAVLSSPDPEAASRSIRSAIGR